MPDAVLEQTETPSEQIETNVTPSLAHPETDSEQLSPEERIAHLHVQGKTIREIAAIVGFSTGKTFRIVQRIKARIGMPRGSMTREQIQQKIFIEAPGAVDVIAETVQDAKCKREVRIKAAADILDRAGFAPVLRTANISIVEEMSADQLAQGLDAILSRAKATLLHDAKGNLQTASDVSMMQPTDALSSDRSAPSREGGITPQKPIGGSHPHSPEQKSVCIMQATQRACAPCRLLFRETAKFCSACGQALTTFVQQEEPSSCP